MDKTEKIKRKIERRLKNRSKQTKFNIEALRREIFSYQFHFINQPTWNQSSQVAIEYDINDIKNKDHQFKSPEMMKK
jgi:hypothetical protein